MILSLLPYPSLGVNERPSPPKAKSQDPPVLVAELVQDRAPREELSRHFRKFDLIRMEPAVVASQVRRNGRLLLKTSLRDFELKLSPHDLRSPDYSAQVIDSNGVAHPLPRPEVHTYKGPVKGLPDAQARMSLTERGIQGAIITKRERYFLQPARSISKTAAADEFVFYESSDLEKHEDGTCGVTLADEIAAQGEAMKPAPPEVIEAEVSGPVPSLSPMKIVRISTDADGEYVTSLGGATQANTHIMSILNFVDGIYQSEVGLTFQIVQQNTWANSASDPYTSTVPSTRLQEFRNHWNANFPNSGANARAIAHLFTGVNLDGSTIGIASFGVACRIPTFAYGLSQQFPFNSSNINAETVVLTAHEIGHNFSASHTNQPNTEIPNDLERPCESTIMEASVGSGSSFCPFSRSQIAGHGAGQSSCLVDTLNPPPTTQDCTVTPLAGSSANGTLGAGDCRSPLRGVEHFADRYSFNGTAGQRVSITMDATGGSLDPYLFLIGPDGYHLAQDDDGNGALNSRIPFSVGTVTLPDTGTYIIEASSFGRQETGSYTVNLNSAGCTISATPSATHFASGGGNGMVNITLNNCGLDNSYQFQVTPSTEAWLSVQSMNGTGNQSINFTVQANAEQAGRRAFLLVGGITVGGGPNDVAAGLKIPITQSGTGPDCVATPIAFGQTLNGSLANGDCRSPVRGSSFPADRYTFTATAGQKIAVVTDAPVGNPDTFLTLLGPNGVVLLTDDDSGGGTNSRIPGGNRSLTLGLPGTYTIEVTGFDPASLGAYSVTLTTESAGGSTIQFAQPTSNANENVGSMTVAVNRSGDTSGTASVDYATSDTAGSSLCNTNSGAASSRCDYLRTLGTLNFAAGETSKNISIPLIDDVYVEGNETFTITLTNATNATLGTATSTVTIVDNDGATGPNPIDNATFFVRQHYVDFLNREPDAPGLNFWVNEITSCGANASCIEVKRINVSAAFFLSIEFQETGYLVYRTYKSAFGNLLGAPVPIGLTDFLRDTQRIGQGVQVNVGDWQTQLETNKQAYMLAFVQRADFIAAFPNSMTATDFVTQLNTRAGNVLSGGEHANLVNILGATPADVAKRAQVLRAVAEDNDLKTAEFNKAFVLMQYFGYMRRSPNEFPDADFDGFNFWLGKLNSFNGNFIDAEMVKAFISAIEYRQRFGP